ncbi:D-tyrosyl-tRNA(Tyr) deacylase [Clostridium sp. NSJ-6]|uniref:D-aminoacyl-tRNA deacylase n=1 Tax=Clostridium hominis TaxID=2763036 RepID=A0ABR7D9H9_9CLOT|nr:D-aminoacyl-tRNA deacylase [Clostridium hominis]MBC5627383.1 D-tyrosyl-tRNA(Tyr) deacylase [Clostridium hominis]MDU2672438.1 D-aminoacyl-tRNA deacylase [Clostridium sp.]
MRAVVQRVKKSSVKVDGEIVGAIQNGLNVLIGICKDDTLDDLKYIVDKVINLRIFHDDNDKMNLSVKDINGAILAISQFTLYGDCRKGRRPNFMNALGGNEAEKLYDKFIEMLRETGIEIATGVFGAHMDVEIQNDGPVTILLDSKKTF